MLVVLLLVSTWFSNVSASDDKYMGCDNHAEVDLQTHYHFQSNNYPSFYEPGSSCRWNIKSPDETRIDFECFPFKIIDNKHCHKQGMDLQGIGTWCGEGKVQHVSTNNSITLALRSDKTSAAGFFSCVAKVFVESIKPIPQKSSKKENKTNNQNDYEDDESSESDEDTCECAFRKEKFGIHKYPMMAALTDFKKIFCGATIISMRYLLTAANCVAERSAENVKIIIGHDDISNIDIAPKARSDRTRFVSGIKIHEGYIKEPWKYNIAIIKCKGNIHLSDEIMPVCLPFVLQNESIIGRKVTTTRWQAKSDTGLTYALYKDEVEITKNENCQKLFTEDELDVHSICTYNSASNSSCEYMPGGPVVYDDTSSGLHLFGIVGRNIDPCNGFILNINTNILTYLPWIIKNTPNAHYCSKMIQFD